MVNYKKQVGQEAAYPIAYPIPTTVTGMRNAIRIAVPLVVYTKI